MLLSAECLRRVRIEKNKKLPDVAAKMQVDVGTLQLFERCILKPNTDQRERWARALFDLPQRRQLAHPAHIILPTPPLSKMIELYQVEGGCIKSIDGHVLSKITHSAKRSTIALKRRGVLARWSTLVVARYRYKGASRRSCAKFERRLKKLSIYHHRVNAVWSINLGNQRHEVECDGPNIRRLALEALQWGIKDNTRDEMDPSEWKKIPIIVEAAS